MKRSYAKLQHPAKRSGSSKRYKRGATLAPPAAVNALPAEETAVPDEKPTVTPPRESLETQLPSTAAKALDKMINGELLKFEVVRRAEGKQKLTLLLKLDKACVSASDGRFTAESQFCVTTKEKWNYEEIDEGDKVRVVGGFDPQTLGCDLDTYESDIFRGYIILDPDTFLSATLVSTASECLIRGYYDLLFPRAEPTVAYPLVLGTIVHDMIELALLNAENLELEDVIIEECLVGRMVDLQTAQKSISDVKEDLREYMENIVDVVEHKMVPGKRLARSAYRFKEVCAVEHKLVSKVYSIKGQIDATIAVDEGKVGRKLAALEIKTGKERTTHSVQACLYALLLRELKAPVNEDQFLLYIKKSLIEPVRLLKHDYTDVIQNRNRVIKMRNDFLKSETANIKGTQGGQKCRFCNHKAFCYMYSRSFEAAAFTGLELFEEVAELNCILTPSIEAYFKKWNACIVSEQAFAENKGDLNGPEYAGERRVRSNPEVVIENEITLLNVESEVSFKKLVMQKVGQFLTDLGQGDYVDIYCTERPTLIMGRGQIVHKQYDKHTLFTAVEIVVADATMLDFQQRKVGLEELRKRIWSVRCSAIACPTYKIMRWAIMSLCSSPDCGRLRDLVIDEAAPEKESESSSKSVLEKYAKLQSLLNEDQIEALRKILQAKDYQMVLGVPGSGKSMLIAVLVSILASEHRRVLIATHTNSAIDNILLRLERNGVRFVRISSNKDSVHPAIRPYMSSALLQKLGTYEDFQQYVNETYIFGATVYGTTTDILRVMKFEYCIIDEASQIVEPACIIPLICSRKFVLIGDYHQSSSASSSSL